MDCTNTSRTIIIVSVIIVILLLYKKDKNRFYQENGGVLELYSDNFDKMVVQDSNPEFIVLVKFKADWCGYCKAIEEPWKKLAKDFSKDKNVVIAEVDMDRSKELGAKNRVEGFPTIVTFKGGKSLGHYKGPRTVEGWKNHINRIRR